MAAWYLTSYFECNSNPTCDFVSQKNGFSQELAARVGWRKQASRCEKEVIDDKLSHWGFSLRFQRLLFFVSGNNGVHYVVQIISKLLDPKTSEHTATFVGRLVSILISKMASQLGENLDLMLRAVLSKMQQAEALTVVQVSKKSDLIALSLPPPNK